MKAAILVLLLGAAAVTAQFNCRTVDPLDAESRSVVPPTLINDNFNLPVTPEGEDPIPETGIRGNDLEIAFTLDDAIYSSAASDELVEHSGAGASTLGFNAASTGFAEAGMVYVDPTFYFTAQAGGFEGFAAAAQIDGISDFSGSDVDHSQCTFVTGGSQVANGVASASISRNEAILGARNLEVEDADGCGAFTMYGRIDFRRALRECGFTSSTTNALPVIDRLDREDNIPLDATYTEFLGALEVVTVRFGGTLRTLEVALREEFGFQITILFPESVNVASDVISVIGEVVEQAAVTHQIWNSGAGIRSEGTFGDVDINVLMGTSFPNAVTTFPTNTALLPSLVLLPDDTAACDNFQEFVEGTDCQNAGGQTIALYDQGIICDNDGNGVCSLGDFVEMPDTDTMEGDFVTPSVQESDDGRGTFGGFVDADDFANFPLPATRCRQSASSDADLNACLQNVWATLRPRPGWCDLNLSLNLTLGVVCRDDANGNDATESDSFIVAGTGGDGVGNVAGTGSLGLQTPAGQPLSCTSSQLPRQQVWIAFSLASDNFCPRVIATGDVTATMALFESDEGHATWGAHEIDVSTDWNLDTTRSSDCIAGATTNLCAQVPLLFAESATAVAGQRKLQSQFVFGTYVYGETRVNADAGVNIQNADLTTLWISTDDENVPTAENETPDTGDWSKLLVSNGAVDTGDLTSYRDDSTVPTGTRVELSQNIVANSLIRIATENTLAIANGAGTGVQVPFFDTNAQTSETGGETGIIGSPTGRLNTLFQGVNRFRVLMDEYTINIQDVAEEAPETITFYGSLAITYEAANDQGVQSVSRKPVVGSVPSANANRARLLASPAITGSQASSSASISPASSSGTASASSGLVGAMLVGAAVFGVVAVGAAAGFFVVRKRKTAARTTKRSSSSMEMNDTAQVQV